MDQYFLKAHPLCCFCGGTKPATTVDHIPARSCFVGRRWPEGYAFPACGDCNATTRITEAIAAAISRCHPDPKDATQTAELLRLVEGIRNNDLPVFLEMTQQKGKQEFARRRTSLVLPPSFINSLPVITVGPMTAKHLSTFAEKLIKALH